MTQAPPGRPLNGRDLAAERVRHGLRAIDVAARLGVSRSRVAALEREWRVSSEMARRYLDALDTAGREPTNG